MVEQSKYYRMIAEAMISNADGICNAIDQYIAKADEDLKETLAEEGYTEAGKTVDAINDLEDKIADILQEQTDAVVETLEDADENNATWDEAKESISKLKENDEVAEQVADAAQDMYDTMVQDLATSYIQESDAGLVVSTLRARTSSWITSWSAQLGELMKVSTHDSLTKLIENTIESGESISQLTLKIMEGGWRSEYSQAKRVAVTEVLRAHSVAAEESIQQSPSTDRKEWRHTGAHKNQPRQNHVDMDHQIVAKDQPFTLYGRDGVTYYPMYPHDPCLPAGECINCHCIHRSVTNDEILGMSLEDRQAMQQKIIDEDDGKWKEELDAQNKEKAGITEYNALESFSKKSRSEQIRYIGGKSKMALYDAGLIDSEEMLKKVKNSTLQELKEDGILTVNSSAMKHSTTGEFTKLSNPNKSASGKNGGNMRAGGHSQANIDELTSRGISYSVEKTYDNGVRIGGVENHNSKSKRIGTTGQSWFPESWSDEKIRAAGTYVANNPATTKTLGTEEQPSGYFKTQDYDGVKVDIIEDAEGNVSTVFPDSIQEE